MTDEPITRRDLEAAVQGATLAVQLTELSKDVGQLISRMDTHEAGHQADKRAEAARRLSSRRFRITATLGAAAGFAGLGALLVDVLARVH